MMDGLISILGSWIVEKVVTGLCLDEDEDEIGKRKKDDDRLVNR